MLSLEEHLVATEIGQYPPDWPVSRVDSIFSIVQGKQVSKRNQVGGTERHFLRTKNVLWGRVDLSDLDSMNFTPSEMERLQLKPGDLLVCEGGSIGRTALWRGEIGDCYYQNHLHRLRLSAPDAADAEFAMYWLWYAFEFAGLYTGRGNKTTIPNLSRSALGALPLPLPPLPEQRRIAQVLGLVQRAIEQEERFIALTTELKQALLGKLLTEGLRGEPQRETEIGLIPESWNVVVMGSLAKIGNGSTPKKTIEAYWNGGTRPWLTSTRIHDRFIRAADAFVTDVAAKECHLPLVKAGSLLIAITGQGKTLGNVAIVCDHFYINQHLAYLHFHSPEIHPEFFLWYLHSQYQHLRSLGQAGGSTKGAITCAELKRYPVPVPAVEEQREIAQILSKIHERKVILTRKRETLSDLLRTLLYQLMAAQIRVHDLDLSALESSLAE